MADAKQVQESKQSSQTKGKAFFFLNNKQARIFRVDAPSTGKTDSSGKVILDKSRAIFLMPGINVVTAAQFEYFFTHPFIVKHGAKIEIGKSDVKPDGFDSFSEVTDHQAAAIIPDILNLDLLKDWKSKEVRPGVAMAINNQIEKIVN